MKYLLTCVGGLVLAIAIIGGGWYFLGKETHTPVPFIGEVGEPTENPRANWGGIDYIVSTWETVYPYIPVKHAAEPEPIEYSEEELAYLTPEDRFALIYPLIDPKSYPEFETLHSDFADNWALLPFDFSAPYWQPTGLKTIYGDDVLAYDKGYMLLGVTIDSTKGFMLIFRNSQLGMSLGPQVEQSIWSFIGEHTEYAGAIAAIPANDYDWHDNGQYGTVKGGLSVNDVRKYGVLSGAEALIGLSAANKLTVGADALPESYNLAEGNSVIIKDGQPTMGDEVVLPQIIRDIYGLYMGIISGSEKRSQLFAEASVFAYNFAPSVTEVDIARFNAETAKLEAELIEDYAAIKEYLNSVGNSEETIREFLAFIRNTPDLPNLDASDEAVLSALTMKTSWGATNGYSQSPNSPFPAWYYEYAVTASVWQTLAQTAQTAVLPYAKAAMAVTDAQSRQAACAIGQTLDGKTVFAAFNGASVANENSLSGVTNADITAKFLEYGVTDGAVTVRGNRAGFGWKDSSMLRVDNTAQEGVRIYSVFTMRR